MSPRVSQKNTIFPNRSNKGVPRSHSMRKNFQNFFRFFWEPEIGDKWIFYIKSFVHTNPVIFGPFVCNGTYNQLSRTQWKLKVFDFYLNGNGQEHIKDDGKYYLTTYYSLPWPARTYGPGNLGLIWAEIHGKKTKSTILTKITHFNCSNSTKLF